ncbi:hypothetical protein H483_0118700 [Dietzia sp. UCD-THP]|nr:hypothetical protein H483_0118700 [Dietzia sp. UCD-THP]
MATGQVQSFVDGRMVRNESIGQLRREFEMRYFGRILSASENPPSNVTEAVLTFSTISLSVAFSVIAT